MNLFLFHNLEQDPIVADLLQVAKTGEKICEAIRGLLAWAPKQMTEGDCVREYILRKMLEQEGLPDITGVRDFLRHDIKEIYQELFHVDWETRLRMGVVSLYSSTIKPVEGGMESYRRSLESMLASTSNEALVGAILAHIESFGTGVAAAYPILNWNDTALEGTLQKNPIPFEALVGLHKQKEIIYTNTENFLDGRPAEDLLLLGESGCGKTACVMACLHYFKDRGLRLIRLSGDQAHQIPEILHEIRNSVLHYIILLEDITGEKEKLCRLWEDADLVQEGKVRVYATGHWSGMPGGDLQENCGLLGFGRGISFPVYTQEEYLEIVKGIAGKAGIVDTNALEEDALAWGRERKDFSGRSAKQFVASMFRQR